MNNLPTNSWTIVGSRISLASDTAITVLLAVRSRGKRPVLISHGNGGTIPALMLNERIKILHRLGYAIFAYDYAGYGQSEGTACYSGLLEYGQAAYNYCVNKLAFASTDGEIG